MGVQIKTMRAEIILDRAIRPIGNTAGVLIPKKHLGKRAIVIIIDENEEKKGGKVEKCENKQ